MFRVARRLAPRVVERVTATSPGERFETEVADGQLRGVQSVTFEPSGDGCGVTLTLDYSLATGGPLRGLTDVLFVRQSSLLFWGVTGVLLAWGARWRSA